LPKNVNISQKKYFDKLEKENMEIGKLLNHLINNPEKYLK
jgi:hypothetical protein